MDGNSETIQDGHASGTCSFHLPYIQVLATVPSYAQEPIRLNEIAGRL